MNGTNLLLAGALLDGAGDPPDHCQPLEKCREHRDMFLQFPWLMGSVPTARWEQFSFQGANSPLPLNPLLSPPGQPRVG